MLLRIGNHDPIRQGLKHLAFRIINLLVTLAWRFIQCPLTILSILLAKFLANLQFLNLLKRLNPKSLIGSVCVLVAILQPFNLEILKMEIPKVVDVFGKKP